MEIADIVAERLSRAEQALERARKAKSEKDQQHWRREGEHWARLALAAERQQALRR